MDINDRCKELLIKFYKNHRSGSEDNCCTNRPVFLVQVKEYDYVPYNDELFDLNDEWEVCYIDYDYDNCIYTSEIEAIKEHYELIGEECSRDIISYKEYEEKRLGYSYKDYFKYYNIEDIDVFHRKYIWVTKAYFLIREEAVRYQEYQKHNLGISRVYADSYGYSNYGEWQEFYDLLLSLGEELDNNKEVEVIGIIKDKDILDKIKLGESIYTIGDINLNYDQIETLLTNLIDYKKRCDTIIKEDKSIKVKEIVNEFTEVCNKAYDLGLDYDLLLETLKNI